MRFYITGANGFIGKHLSQFLENEGHEVFSYVRGDEIITDKHFDVIINCAAEIHNEDPQRVFSSNVELPFLLQTLCDYTRFIQIGTSLEYGNSTSKHAFNLYSGSKSAASILTLSFGGTVVRPYSVYGSSDRHTKLLPVMLQKLHENLPVTVYDGEHDWIYIDDFVNAIYYILCHNLHGEFDVCTGTPTSNMDLVRTLSSLIGSDSPIIEQNTKYRDYDREGWVGNTSRLPSGWQPQYDLKQGLKECVRMYRIES